MYLVTNTRCAKSADTEWRDRDSYFVTHIRSDRILPDNPNTRSCAGGAHEDRESFQV